LGHAKQGYKLNQNSHEVNLYNKTVSILAKVIYLRKWMNGGKAYLKQAGKEPVL